MIAILLSSYTEASWGLVRIPAAKYTSPVLAGLRPVYLVIAGRRAAVAELLVHRDKGWNASANDGDIDFHDECREQKCRFSLTLVLVSGYPLTAVERVASRIAAYQNLRPELLDPSSIIISIDAMVRTSADVVELCLAISYM